MSETASQSKPDRLPDLTRWNRAGLSRFNYVDGDAASWLEELRIATMRMVARGAPIEERLPETWHDRLLSASSPRPTRPDHKAFGEKVVWDTLTRAWPGETESARQRNKRLLEQYGFASEDYGWEIMRAAARVAHVLLGHLDAYANEGYLRTATQWGNLARLAEMVNYQPAPPSSAITPVGLLLDPTEDKGAIEIAPGLAMKFAPADGGPPVIYETLNRITAHAELGEVRALGWDCDPTSLKAEEWWIDDGKAELSPGTLAVLAEPGGTGQIKGVRLLDVERNEADGVARIGMGQPDASWTRGKSELHLDPKAIRKGLPRTTSGTLVLKLDTAGNYPLNSLVRLEIEGLDPTLAVVGNSDGHLRLSWENATSLQDGDEVTVETLVPVADAGSKLVASPEIMASAFYLADDDSVKQATGNLIPIYEEVEDIAGKITKKEVGFSGLDFSHKLDVVGSIYSQVKGAKRESAIVVATPPAILTGQDEAKRIVRFAGKPPKGLSIGDLMVACTGAGSDVVKALRIAAVAAGADGYTLQFHADVSDDAGDFKPDEFEFAGPMTRRLLPVDHDRNPQSAFSGREIVIKAPSAGASEQLRIGRKVLIEDDSKSESERVTPVLGEIAEATLANDSLKLVLESSEGLAAFRKGWTKLNLNTVFAGHGESKSPKVLGSGDGEKPWQSFPFGPRDVSFVPSSVAEAGVAPAMEVTVNGTLWTYRDLIDPRADGEEAWSSTHNEDGSLVIRFRRRLPTGTDNVVVRRYRTGTGPGGATPARAFTEPMKKHRWVTGITQPFPSSGGANREPVEDIRKSVPARLAANGRAVSIADFERLCRRRSDVWQAQAYPITDPARSERVGIILVPANGGPIGPALKLELTDFIESRALPGIRVAFDPYRAVSLSVAATVRVDVEAFDRNQVQAAAQAALIDTFSLRHRSLGQPAYIAEAVAALERVEGVMTATIGEFAIGDNTPERDLLRVAKQGGKASSAFFPHRDQVICVNPSSAVADIAIKVEAA